MYSQVGVDVLFYFFLPCRLKLHMTSLLLVMDCVRRMARLKGTYSSLARLPIPRRARLVRALRILRISMIQEERRRSSVDLC